MEPEQQVENQQVEEVLERELARSPLGHKSRHKRLVQVGKALWKSPTSSLPQQFLKEWAGLKGAYRFFSNPQVTHQGILEGHIAATRERCLQRRCVLVLQDTTTLVFKHEVEGSGRINQFPQVHGLLVHTLLAVDAQTHEVLGVLGQMVWARPKRKRRKETGAQRKKRPRESLRWAEGACQVADLFSEVAEQEQPLLVQVLDAEGDIFETLQVLESLGHGCVIRATRNRLLAPQQPQQPGHAAARQYLLDTVRQAPVRGQTVVHVPRRPGHAERDAVLEIRACRVHLAPPANRARKGQPLSLNVVLAHETHPPKGQQPLSWCLLTTLPIDTLEQCLAVVRAYKERWLLEELHMGFKSGCGTEQRQLKHQHRLTNFLALATVVAYSMLCLRDAARRTHPPAASEHFSQVQLTLLGQMCPKLPPAPNAYAALRALASLGGFIGRKSDGEPGWRTLWRGWEKLLFAEVVYRLALQLPRPPATLDSG